MRCAAISSWETLARYDEGCGVGSEIEKQLREDVEGQEGTFAERIVCEADDAEKKGEDRKATDLNRPTANRVDEGN